MGMDYVPIDPASDAGGGFHLNWTGHRYMAELLEQLGADLTEWSGSNDGDVISDATCKAHAALLYDALERGVIMERKVADKSYAGGFVHWPHVNGGHIGEIRGMYDTLDKSFGRATATATPEIEPVSDDTREWIRSFADFLRDCGGCQQY